MCPIESSIYSSRLSATKPGAVERGDLGFGPNVPRPLLEVVLKNTGNAPAVRVKTAVFTDIKPELPSDDHVYSLTRAKGAESTNTMGKDVPISIHAPPPVSITPDFFDDIMNRRAYLMIYGYATYDDIFRPGRRTKFCYFYAPELNSMVGCPHHNDVQ